MSFNQTAQPVLFAQRLVTQNKCKLKSSRQFIPYFSYCIEQDKYALCLSRSTKIQECLTVLTSTWKSLRTISADSATILAGEYLLNSRIDSGDQTSVDAILD